MHEPMKKKVVPALIFFFVIYVFSYAALSSFGAYAPNSWGLRGPKSYAWAPWGFYIPTSGKWCHAPILIYAPLLLADEHFWHDHFPFPKDSDPKHAALLPDFFKRK